METSNSLFLKEAVKLSRIELTDTERENFASELDEILSHFKQLSEVDVAGIEPLVQPFEVP